MLGVSKNLHRLGHLLRSPREPERTRQRRSPNERRPNEEIADENAASCPDGRAQSDEQRRYHETHERKSPPELRVITRSERGSGGVVTMGRSLPALLSVCAPDARTLLALATS
jgi:hypothetical protein